MHELEEMGSIMTNDRSLFKPKAKSSKTKGFQSGLYSFGLEEEKVDNTGDVENEVEVQEN